MSNTIPFTQCRPRHRRWRLITVAALALAACEAEPDDLSDDADARQGDEELQDDEGMTSGGPLSLIDPESDVDPDEPVDEPVDPDLPGADVLATDVKPVQIGAVSVWSWGTPGNNGPDLNLGSASDRTCFLVGVTGDLEGQWNGARAGVWVLVENGQWKLRTHAGVGTGVMGHAACIPTTYNQQFIAWSGNSENSGTNKVVFPKSGPRGLSQCFLTSVTGTDGWKSPNSWAGLKKENIYENGSMVPKWTLSGNLLWEQDNTAGGSASAVCVDIFQSISGWSWVPWSGSPPVTGDLGSTSNRVCSLHRLSGNLAAAPGGWWDGLRIFASSGHWKVISQSGKGGWGDCLANIVWGF